MPLDGPTTEDDTPDWKKRVEQYIAERDYMTPLEKDRVRVFAKWLFDTFGPSTLHDQMTELFKQEDQAKAAVKQLAKLGYKWHNGTWQYDTANNIAAMWPSTGPATTGTFTSNVQSVLTDRLRRQLEAQTPRYAENRIRIDPTATAASDTRLYRYARYDIAGTQAQSAPEDADRFDTYRYMQMASALMDDRSSPAHLQRALADLERHAQGRQFSARDAERYMQGSTLSRVEQEQVLTEFNRRRAERSRGVVPGRPTLNRW